MKRQSRNQLNTSPLLAIVQVRLNRQNGVTLNNFKSHILEMPEVALCLQIAGAFDFLLHVSVVDMQDFQVFLATKLTSCLVVSQTDVSIVLSVCKCFNKELIA
jgi:DNA-binding Lrp family transcriptional regulator